MIDLVYNDYIIVNDSMDIWSCTDPIYLFYYIYLKLCIGPIYLLG